MPLVVLCGLPSSGKSTRAKEIKQVIITRYPDKTVTIVTDDFTSIDKNRLYSSSINEKTGRANLKSKVERYLTSDNVVILDSLNYIKGFRYELYCISKHVKATHCIVQCDTPLDTIKTWDKTRPPNEQYGEVVIAELAMRFESPNSMSRWDSPLFVVYPGDLLPSDDLIDVLFHRKPPPPNLSTQNQPLSSVNFLHELDRRTQLIISKILELNNQNLLTSSTCLPGTEEHLQCHRDYTMAELRRARHQFIIYTKLHPVENMEQIPTLFVQYLNRSM